MARGDLVRLRPVIAADAAPAAAPTGYLLDETAARAGRLVSLDAERRDPDAGRRFQLPGNKFNRATQGDRPPGSGFKPFLYAAAFEHGFKPASIVLDAPVVFQDRRGLVAPQNDGDKFEGPIRLREALVKSGNLVSVRLLDAIGVHYAREYITRFGFDDRCPPTFRWRSAPPRCRR